MPVTCRLELLGRSPDGDIAQAFPNLSGSSNLQVIGMILRLRLLFGGGRFLSIVTVITGLVSAVNSI